MVYRDTNTLENLVEIKDIDPKRGSVRIITMPLNIFEELLNSEAFMPKNCLIKEKEITKTLKQNE